MNPSLEYLEYLALRLVKSVTQNFLGLNVGILQRSVSVLDGFPLGGSSLAWLRLTEAKPSSQSEEKTGQNWPPVRTPKLLSSTHVFKRIGGN